MGNRQHREHQRAPRVRGFTLLELMISLAVLAIGSTVAVPSMSTFLQNSALRGQAHDLLGAITLARSEAGKRGSRVIMCRTANPDAATPACGGSNNDWATGWLLFVAENANNTFELGTDILLGKGDRAPNRVDVTSNGVGNNYLVFKPDGSLDETGVARYALCDERGTSAGKLITVTLVGRASLDSGTDSNPLTTCAPPG